MEKQYLTLTDPETGVKRYIDESKLPENLKKIAAEWQDDSLQEVDEDTYNQMLNAAGILPIGPGELKLDVFSDNNDEEDAKSLGTSNQESNNQEPVEYIGNSRKGRGDNFGGGVRNILQGLLFGFGDEIEAGIRSLFGDKSYDEYLQNARESYKGYSAMHPDTAMAMQIGGALLPTLLTLGMSSPATGASIAGLATKGALMGTGTGALQGFGSGEGENRLENAASNALLGGALGAASPALIKGGQNIANWTSQVKKGMGPNISRTEAGQRMIDLVSGANDDAINNTMILSRAASKGEEGIQKAANDINLLKMQADKAAAQGYNPKIVEGYGDILESLKTPEMRAADQAYANFAASVPEGANSGMAMNTFFKNHPAAAKSYARYGEKLPGVKPNSFEGMRDVNNTLRNQLKKANKAQNYALADDLEDAISDLSIIRENTTPGIRELDKAWSKARNKQDVVDKVFFDNTKKIASPTEMLSPEVSATGVARTTYGPRVRGIARELVETGRVAPAGSGTTNQIIQKAFSPVENIGVGGLRIGPVPTTRAGQAIMLDYGLSSQNIE